MIIQFNKILSPYPNSFINRWLFITCILVIMTLAIGGLTRMMHAGLSIVEWQPISGVLFPWTNEAWSIEFKKYQLSPEYIKINNNLTLYQFKFIYFLEYFHRLFGRITGLFFVLPLIFNLKKFNRKKLVFLVIALLFAFQGLIGWLMVKSGLHHHPYVSHFRLAIHLETANIIYAMLYWQYLQSKFTKESTYLLKSHIVFFPIILLCLVFCQLFIGGLVAGLNGGLICNDFPYMNSLIIPHEIDSFYSLTKLNNAVIVQFIHRNIAYLIFSLSMVCIWRLKRLNIPKLNQELQYFFITIIIQILSGIFTLIYNVPIFLALIHQIGIVFIISCILRMIFFSKYQFNFENSKNL